MAKEKYIIVTMEAKVGVGESLSVAAALEELRSLRDQLAMLASLEGVEEGRGGAGGVEGLDREVGLLEDQLVKVTLDACPPGLLLITDL